MGQAASANENPLLGEMRELVKKYESKEPVSSIPGGIPDNLQVCVTMEDFRQLVPQLKSDMMWRTKHLETLTRFHNRTKLIEKQEVPLLNKVNLHQENREAYRQDIIDLVTIYLPTEVPEEEKKALTSLKKEDLKVLDEQEYTMLALDLQYHVLVDAMMLKAIHQPTTDLVVAYYKDHLNKHKMMFNTLEELIVNRFEPKSELVNFWRESW
jgi:hypothetical protein